VANPSPELPPRITTRFPDSVLCPDDVSIANKFYCATKVIQAGNNLFTKW